MNDLARTHRQLDAAAKLINKAQRFVIVTVASDNQVSAHEGGTLATLFRMATDEVLCVVRPGIPVSHAKAMIYFQLLERERMGKGTI